MSDFVNSREFGDVKFVLDYEGEPQWDGLSH